MSNYKFEFKPLKQNIGYTVTIDYEHGDADLTTNSVQYLEGVNTQDELAEWLTRFDKVADMINDINCYGGDIKSKMRKIDEYSIANGIETVRDRIYDASDYYANMCVSHIAYCDELGVKYNVIFTKA